MSFFKWFLRKMKKDKYDVLSAANISCNLDEDDINYLEKNTPHKDIVVNKERSN